jgi:hypothetical protein
MDLDLVTQLSLYRGKEYSPSSQSAMVAYMAPIVRIRRSIRNATDSDGTRGPWLLLPPCQHETSTSVTHAHAASLCLLCAGEMDVPPQQILQQALMSPLPPLRRHIPKLVLFRLDGGLILVGRPSEADRLCPWHRHFGWRVYVQISWTGGRCTLQLKARGCRWNFRNPGDVFG